MSADIYSAITDRFVAALEGGVVPWQKQRLESQNLISKKEYRGINALLLGLADRSTPHWMTFKQASELGGKVVKGEKSMPIIFWKLVDRVDANGVKILDADGQPVKQPFVRWSNVFNLDQTVGIKAPEIIKNSEAVNEPGLEKAARLVVQSRIHITHASGTPHYNPTTDMVQVPAVGTFKSAESYYKTVFHEITHATGHKDRLNREGITQPIKFGSERYSREELIAELGASFLSNDCQILGKTQFDNSASYLQSWIKTLKENPKMLVQASSKAQAAADWVISAPQRELAKVSDQQQQAEFDKMLASYAQAEAKGPRKSRAADPGD